MIGVLREFRTFNRRVRILLVNQLAIYLGFFMLLPYLSLYLSSGLGLAGWAVGLILGVRNFCQQGMFLVGGTLTDRFGYRLPVILGCVLRTVGFALLGVVTTVGALIPAAMITGLAGQPDPADRPPFVPVPGVFAVLGDLAEMESFGEGQHRGGLAQPGERVDRDRALGLVPVLGVAVHDVPQILVQRGQLRGLDRSEVGVPLPAPLVVVGQCRLTQRSEFARGRWFGLRAGWGVHKTSPAFLACQGEIVQPDGALPGLLSPQRRVHTSSSASA